VIESTSPTTQEFGLTSEQIALASYHLSTTRDALVELVAGLLPSQWSFRPTAESWSIAENVEHLVLIESRVQAIIRNMENAPEAISSGGQIEMDAIILREVPNRSTKLKAPEPVCPQGRWSGEEALQCFFAGRERTIQLLAAPLLRGRVRPHPLFGLWDGYQWLLAAGLHTERHTEQIREARAHPMFPSATGVATIPSLSNWGLPCAI
jgi:DinB superfamily